MKTENEKPKAIICDLDGTLALSQGRDFYNYTPEELMQDKVVPEVRAALFGLCLLEDIRHILFVTGRKEDNGITENWLKEIIGTINPIETKGSLGLPSPVEFSFGAYLLMRKPNDYRADWVVKGEIYDRQIKPIYNVVAVFEDRPSVITKCWEPRGLFVFKVGPLEREIGEMADHAK